MRATARRAVPAEERDLVLRLLTTLIREDVAGLRSRGRLVLRGDGVRWLAMNELRIPVRPAVPERGDLLADLAVRAPFVLRTRPGRRIPASRLPAVLNVLNRELIRGLAPELSAELSAGFTALRVEALAARAAAGLRRRRRPRVFGRLRPELAGPAALGWPGAIGFETLAAHRDHPLYPFSPARVGLPVAELVRVAPEHRPELALRWLALPRSAIEARGRLPAWWPSVAGDDVALPVHPAVPEVLLQQALAEVGLDAGRLEVPGRFRPTLSLRTVVPLAHPAVHLKLPLPIRTLGRLNLRVMPRRGLADGALVGRVLARIRAAEPELADQVRVADESTWLHAGHPLLAVLVRQWPSGPARHDLAPDGLAEAAIVPVAGLAGVGPDGRPVIAALAARFFDGDLDRLIAAYLGLVIDTQVGLWLKYGVVLEAHPQNVLVAVDRPARGPRIRLLLRDLDSAKLDLGVLTGALGPPASSISDLSDPRLAAGHPGELADLFVTTTLHQCVAAVLIDVARALGRARPGLDLVRPLLAAALESHSEARDSVLLRTEIMEASRLPVKRALTAATLLPKTRTGAADVNKYYGAVAPTYL